MSWCQTSVTRPLVSTALALAPSISWPPPGVTHQAAPSLIKHITPRGRKHDHSLNHTTKIIIHPQTKAEYFTPDILYKRKFSDTKSTSKSWMNLKALRSTYQFEGIGPSVPDSRYLLFSPLHTSHQRWYDWVTVCRMLVLRTWYLGTNKANLTNSLKITNTLSFFLSVHHQHSSNQI